MAGRKIDPSDKDHAVDLYLGGKTIVEAAAEAGIGTNTLAGELRARGIKARNRRIIDLPASEVATRYLDGESELALAHAFGVERGVIRRHLVASGVSIRGRSAAGRVRAAAMTAEARAAQAAAAHDAVRGREVPWDERRKRALAHQRRGGHASVGEEQLAAEMLYRGVEAVPQVAIDVYNVDLAIGDVAVEVLGGEWHASKPTHAQRTEAILDAGWHLVFVWDTLTYPLTGAAADYVVAFMQETSRNPSSVREYRVIRGDGEEVARGRADGDGFTLIPPARCA